jgi:hypothetical protein
MRKIVAWLFLSLDGVVESPERWVMFNDEMGEAINAEADAADTQLFDDGGDQVVMTLGDSRAFSTGVLALTYQPAGGANLT